MTPQQKKADELVERFSDYSNYYKRGETGFLEWSTLEGKTNAIQCAIICVEEMLSCVYIYAHKTPYEYWQSVLNELKSRL